MRKIVQHAKSGEKFVVQLDAGCQIIAIGGPYHYSDLEGVTGDELEDFCLDDDDAEWARDQEWRYPRA